MKPRRRLWPTILALSVAFALLAHPVTQSVRQSLQEENQKLEKQKASLTRQLRQWEQDAQTARELRAAMQGDSIESYLAPGDRAAMAAQLEPLAAPLRLEDLLYTLGPAEPWAGDPAFPGLSGLSQSRLTLEGKAWLDTDLWRYLRALEGKQGRMDLQHLSLKRESGQNGSARLRFIADMLWIAPSAEEAGHP